MKTRLLSIIIVCTLILNSVTFMNLKVKEQRPPTQSVEAVELIKTSSGDLEANSDFEGEALKATYDSSSKEYKLYRDNMSYNVDVNKYDENVVVDVDFDNPKLAQNEDIVVAQFALAIPIVLWSSSAISAAVSVINAVVIASVAVGTAVLVWYSANSIAQAISRSYVRVGTLPRTLPPGTYYRAALFNSTVVFNPRAISFAEAVVQLKAGLDLFATNSNDAYRVCLSASKIPQTPKWDPPHQMMEGYYPHWHPGGVRSAPARLSFSVYPNAAPHCWYPLAK